MQDYLVLIYKNDQNDGYEKAAWVTFPADIENQGYLRGGSFIGGTTCVSKFNALKRNHAFTGYRKIATSTFEEAQTVCENIPHYHTGATI